MSEIDTTLGRDVELYAKFSEILSPTLSPEQPYSTATPATPDNVVSESPKPTESPYQVLR